MPNYNSSHTGSEIDGAVTKVNASGVTQTELSYLDGLSSNIQTQLGLKAALNDNTQNIIANNITVHGTLTTKDSQNVNIGDAIITLNAEETGTPSENAGFEIERGTSTNTVLRWNESSDRWEFTNDGSTFYNIPISTEYNNYTLPTASSSTLGGIKVGTNLSIDGNGVLSASGSFTSFTIADSDSTQAIGDGVHIKFAASNSGAYGNSEISGSGTSGSPYLITLYAPDTNTTDLNTLSAGTINTANDSIGFIDADDSNASKKESIADFLTAIAGSGISASSGQLSRDSMALNQLSNVSSVTPSTGQYLVYGGSQWEPTSVTAMTSWYLRDGDTTAVQVTNGKYVKFVEGNNLIDINFTDTDSGAVDDEFDVTFTVNSSNITSVGTLTGLTTSGDISISTSSDPALTFTSAESSTDNWKIYIAGSGLKFRNTTDSNTAFELTHANNGVFTGTVTWSGGSSTNANTAYGWGDHASAGYLENLTGTSIKTLLDVASNSPSNGQILQWNSTANYYEPVTFTSSYSWYLRDGDTTAVEITSGKYVKLVEGTGIDINFTDTSSGAVDDEYDVTITNTLMTSGGTISGNVTISGNDRTLRLGGTSSETQGTLVLGGSNSAGSRVALVANSDSSYLDAYGGEGSTERYRDFVYGARSHTFRTSSGSSLGTALTIDSSQNSTFNGVVTYSISSGTIMSRGGFSDFIGYNSSYGTYIGGGASNASRYIYAGGYFWDGSSIRTLYHTGNLSPITTSNIGSQSVTAAVRLSAFDVRTIDPADFGNNRVRFGFTSYGNDNSSPYADAFHLSSYGDSSGGSPNLVMFKKSGIGMRIWQQSFNSSTSYSSYADVVLTTGDYAMAGKLRIAGAGAATSWHNISVNTGGFLGQYNNSSGIGVYCASNHNELFYYDYGAGAYDDGIVTFGSLDFKYNNSTSLLNLTSSVSIFGNTIRTSTNTDYAQLLGKEGGLEVRSSRSSNAGIALSNSSGSFRFQLYGDGSNYGFLDGFWAAWDIKKVVNGALHLYGSGDNETRIGSADEWGRYETLNHTNGTYVYTNYGDFRVDGGHWNPYSNATRNLGSDSLRWNNIWINTTAQVGQLKLNNNFILRQGTSDYGEYTAWLQSSGGHGLWFPSTSMTSNPHWYPVGTGYSYGTFRIDGHQQQWAGIVHGTHSSKPTYMHRETHGGGGLYYQTQPKWAFYWDVSNQCLGVDNATTSSSYSLYVSGGIYSTGDVVAFSDARVKTNVVTIDNPLDKVLNMRGVYYNPIDKETKEVDDRRRVGVIAQELNEVLPEAVTYAEDVDEYGVDYGKLTGVLIEAIKELKQEINELKGN